MRKFFVAGPALAGSILAAATAPAAVEMAPIQPDLDYHSFANVEQFRITRMELDLNVDSSFKALHGVVGLHIKRLDPSATELVLDTRDLNITDVTEKAQDVLGATSKSETTWVSRPYHLEKKDPILGSALVIELAPSKRPTEFIRIDYDTLPASPALHWLTAKQAGGNRKAFFYTLSEPIGARGWIPLQDTPQVRMSYSATIHTFSNERVLMTGKNDPKAKHGGEVSFAMTEAIPSYLIALAVGDAAFKETGSRGGVYADKSLIKEAAKEFADAESLVQAGEKLFGAYRWDRYDILVMPPSFPRGSMENPGLSFITSTAIGGDRGQIAMAQALAHSWAGNLVSNATWRDLWLNEGFSSYLGSRIREAVYGERRETMERVLALRSLREDLAKLKPSDQVLAIDLRGRDPSEALNTVPAEKGRLLLTFLESKFGRERFDAFLRGYFDHFAFKSITTEQFLKYLQENLLDRFPGVVTRDQVMAWVDGPGIPPDAVLPTAAVFASVDEARSAWESGKVAAKKLATRDWAAPQWMYFLDTLPALTSTQLQELDQAFGFTRSADAELGRSWFLLVIRNHYQPAYVRLEEYLTTVGRRSLITPLYEELMKTPAGSTQAKRVYATARRGYHPQTVVALDAIVTPDAESSDE